MLQRLDGEPPAKKKGSEVESENMSSHETQWLPRASREVRLKLVRKANHSDPFRALHENGIRRCRCEKYEAAVKLIDATTLHKFGVPLVLSAQPVLSMEK